MSSYEAVDYTSRPVAATKSEGNSSRLGDVLQQLLPNLIAPAVSPAEHATSTASSSHEGGQELQRANFEQFSDTHSVIVSGIQPSLQTPLEWLYHTLRAPDMFLYIVVAATL